MGNKISGLPMDVDSVLQDLAQTVLQISDTPYNESEISQLPRVSYEFPNGLNLDFGEERYRIPYVNLFQLKYAKKQKTFNSTSI